MQRDAAGQFSDLTSRYVQDNVRLWQRYIEEVRRVSETSLAHSRAGAPATSVLAGAARDLMQLGLSHYSNVLGTYADFTTGLISSLLNPPPPHAGEASERAAGAAEAAASKPGPNIELTFAGEHGQVVAQSFAVGNKRDTTVDVGFEVSEFVSEDRAHRCRLPVVFTPERFSLVPGAEQVVECRVALAPSLTPNVRYVALTRLAGFPGMQTALIVVARERQASEAPQSDTTDSRKSGASSRGASRGGAAARRPSSRARKGR